MDRLTEMEAFVTVVDHGGFTEAARQMGLSKSAVSKHVAALEMRRLPVVDRDKRLVGIVSLANFAHSRDPAASQELLRGVARPH